MNEPGGGPAARLLLIHSCPEQRDLLQSLLKSAGYAVEARPPEAAAALRFDRRVFDAILLGGEDVEKAFPFDRLAAAPPAKQAGLLLLCGEVSRETARRVGRLGRGRLLCEPVEPEELLAAVDRLLEP